MTGNFINSLHPPAPQRRAQPLVPEDQGQVDLLQVHRPANREGGQMMAVLELYGKVQGAWVLRLRRILGVPRSETAGTEARDRE